MIWLTADLHLGHANILKYCSRPFETVEQMDSVLIDNWNSVVKDEDTVWVLGDFVFNKKVDIIGKLKGIIYMVRGNHDRSHTRNKILSWGVKELHNKPLDIKLEGRLCRLMHAPVETHLNRDAVLNLCGHVHGNWKTNGLYYNVGVDVHDFKPISLGTILKERGII